MDGDAEAGADFCCADGGRLRYAAAGRGEPVLLVHGFGLDRRLWDPQSPALGVRHRVIRPDLRGYGESSLPTGPYSHADDLLALLAAQGAAPAHVVGLSMGGAVALGLALARPEAVRSLTLVDSILEGYRMSDEWGARWRAVVAAARDAGVAEAKRLWSAHELFAALHARPELGAPLEAMLARYSGWHWTHKDPVTASARPAIERLAEVRVPTLVVVGERDLPDFHGVARRLAADIPGATLAVLPGASHLPNLEVPAEFNALVLAHFAAGAARR